MKDYRKHKIAYAIYAIEGILLLYFVGMLFSPKASVVIQGSNMYGLADGVKISRTEGAFYERTEECQEEVPILITEDFELRSGAYEITVQYESAENMQESSESVWDGNGKLKIYSDENPSGILASEMILDNEHTEKTTRLWIKSGYQMKDLKAEILCTGMGRIKISSITLKEKSIWRFTRLFGYLLICFLINQIYYFFLKEKFCGMRDTKKVYIGILAVIILFSSLPCFTDFLFYGHDLDFHLARISALADSVKARQFPQRIQQSMLNGYGYAAPLFYGELFLYIPAILYNLYVPLQVCYQIYIVFINALTCLISYYCIEKITGQKMGGALGAFLYTCSSYRLTNVYVRAAVGEYTALAFLPLVVLGIFQIYEKEREEKIGVVDILPLVFGISGVIQSHVITTYMTGVFMGIFFLLNLKKTFEKERIIALFKAGGLTIFLNLWFLIPFWDSMKMDIAVRKGENVNRMNMSSVYLPQLLEIFHTGSGANQYYSMKGEMPLTVGSALILGMICFGVCAIRQEEWHLREQKEWKSACWSFGLALIAVFFTLNICPWDMLESYCRGLAKMIGAIQFPWRYLGVATLFMVFTTVLCTMVIEKNSRVIGIMMVVFTIILLAVLEEGLFYRDFMNQSENETVYSDNDVNDFEIGQGEYLLANTMLMDLGTHRINTKPQTVLQNFTEKNGRYYLSVKNEAVSESYADIPVLAYDNYHAYDTKTKQEFEIQHIDTSCRIRVMIPARYDGEIEISYQEPARWKVCEMISITSAAIVMLVVIKVKWKGEKK